MTINQAIDQLTSGKKLTPDQKQLKLSLQEMKLKQGGRTQLENEKEIKEILDQTPDKKS